MEYRYLLGRDHSFKAQEFDEVSEREVIMLVNAHQTCAIAQVPGRMIGGYVGDLDPLLLEPLAEAGCQQKPPMNRTGCITLGTGKAREPVKEDRKRAVRCP